MDIDPWNIYTVTRIEGKLHSCYNRSDADISMNRSCHVGLGIGINDVAFIREAILNFLIATG